MVDNNNHIYLNNISVSNPPIVEQKHIFAKPDKLLLLCERLK